MALEMSIKITDFILQVCVSKTSVDIETYCTLDWRKNFEYSIPLNDPNLGSILPLRMLEILEKALAVKGDPSELPI